jgi:ubiquinone/menaquinone biosynthesis C-methylase UbiE
VNKRELRAHFDSLAGARERWRRRARGYHAELERFVRFLVPPEATVLEIGCGTGDLLAAVASPGKGLGVDFSPAMIGVAARRHRRHRFVVGDAECLPLRSAFDYVILSDLVGNLEDVQCGLMELHRVVGPRSRVVITYYNYLWEPVLRAAERLGLKMPQPVQHWLPRQDIENILRLSGFDVVRTANLLLFPVAVPVVAPLANRILARLPGLQRLALMHVVIARPAPRPLERDELSVSVVIPCRNERGNVAAAVARVPAMGRHTELIFVEGHSTDGTAEAIDAAIRAHPDRAISPTPRATCS